MTDDLNQIMREAIAKSKTISIRAAAKMCDMKIDCPDPGHDERYCARCSAMKDAADVIQQRILSLLNTID